ncbi:MAG: hypothetical protein JF611_13910 [Betaproteobacteria bacterium]|nr:hypothetical protein [Betaproteobacteria bacterium]
MSYIGALNPVVAFAIAVLAVIATPAYSWHGNGNVSAVAVDSLTPGTLYAGTGDRGVFKSTNGGAKWSPTGLTNTPVYALVVDPRVPTTLYAVTPSGIVKSLDGGDSWGDTALMNCVAGAMECPILNGLPVQNSVATLAISAPSDPSLPAVLYAGMSWYDASFTYYWGEVVWSPNGGLGWGPVTPGGNPWAFPALRVAPSLAIAPASQNAPATLYVTGSNENDVCSVKDDGATIACALLDQAFAGATALAVDPRNADIVYAGNVVGVYKSLDGGVTWRRGATGSIAALLIDPRNPDTVYAGTADRGVLKSTDGGATWVALGADLTGYLDRLALFPNISALAIDPLVPTTLYAGTPGGVFKSVDSGATWMPTALIQHSALISLNVPPRVMGGRAASGTVVFNAPAPEGGAVVALSSSDSTAAGVPASVTIPAGATSASFAIATNPTNYYLWVTISGTFDDLTKSAQVIVVHPLLLSLNPNGLIGGKPATGSVTLGLAAPPGGAVVSLSSSNSAVASVPASVTVPAGAMTATFTVSTSAVSTNAMVSIGAAYDGASPYVYLQVVPSTLSSLTLSPKTVAAGTASTATVVLTAPAPAGGAAIALSSSDTSLATVPTSVTVPAAATSASFTVSTSSVIPPTDSTKSVSILGSYNGQAYDVLFVTSPPEATISSLSLNATSVTGGGTSTGTVTLNSAAPAAGTAVALTSSDPTVAAVAASVVVPGGATSATFTVTTNGVTTSTNVTITGTNGGASRSAQLLVNPPPAIALSTLSFVPASVTAGTASTGTVSLTAGAPPGGAVVSLSSSNPAIASVPGSAIVAPGGTSVNFTVSTLSCTSGSVTLSASYDGGTKSAGLGVTSSSDNVTIQQADYSGNKDELRMAARSSNSGATLRVYVSSSEQMIGTLRNLGDGRYSGQFSWSVNPQNITVRSSACGSAISAVSNKR